MRAEFFLKSYAYQDKYLNKNLLKNLVKSLEKAYNIIESIKLKINCKCL